MKALRIAAALLVAALSIDQAGAVGDPTAAGSATAGTCLARPDVRLGLQLGAQHAARVLLDERGAARGDYDLVRGQWTPYEPAWHTGQLILGLLNAHRITGDGEFLSAARRGGEWWISQELREPPALRGLLNAWHGGPLGKLINFTTISDGTPGLFELSRVTGDRRFADTATRSAEWLLRETYEPRSKLFYNIIDPDSGQVWRDRSPHHPNSNPATLTQVARPNVEGWLLKDVCTDRARPQYCRVFLEVIDALLPRQHSSGFWMEFEPNDPVTQRVHPRFNLWYAEALLEAYKLEPKPQYLDAALRTARGMAALQRPDGSILYDNFLDGRSREGSWSGSAVAFSGIVWLRLENLRPGSGLRPHIERSARWLLRNQFPADHPDPNLRGGFLETRLRSSADGARIEYRDISTAFALRFLAAYSEDCAARPAD